MKKIFIMILGTVACMAVPAPSDGTIKCVRGDVLIVDNVGYVQNINNGGAPIRFSEQPFSSTNEGSKLYVGQSAMFPNVRVYFRCPRNTVFLQVKDH